MLQLSGVDDFVVLEAGDEPGGLCRTKRVGDHVLDIGGGHFLCTKYPEVYDFIFHHIARSEFRYFERISKVSIDGHQIDYPIESNIWQLPSELCAKYLDSIMRNGEARGIPQPQDFEAWIRWKLGDRIAEQYMLPYNRKIWGVEPSEMDIDWLHKIPRLDIEEIVKSCRTRQMDRDKMPSHAGFYYPKRGGFQRIFDAILKPVLPHVQIRTPGSSIEGGAGQLIVNGRYRTKVLVNTAPWDTLVSSPIFDDDILAKIRDLRHNSLAVSLHEEQYRSDAHWVYVPAESISYHRKFYIHNFAPHSARSGVYRETNVKRWCAHGDAIFTHVNEHAYPIPTKGWARSIDAVTKYCGHLGIYGLGRWGQWQYFNSDVCIREAMLLCKRLQVSWKLPQS
jgi:protoporphyrinogen oxidase